VAFQPVPDER